MTEQKENLELVQPDTDAMRAEYHAMRKRMLFDPYGRSYDEDHPDESQEGNHCRVLRRNGEIIGTVRIDINAPGAAFRLFTIREDLQGRGYGRSMVMLSESFVQNQGCCRVELTAGDQSVGFWEKCGYTRSSDRRQIIMWKDLGGW